MYIHHIIYSEIVLSSDTSNDLGEGLLRLFNYNEKNKIDIFRKNLKTKTLLVVGCNWVTQIVQKLFVIQKILIGLFRYGAWSYKFIIYI